MSDCKTCGHGITDGNLLECKNCGATVCTDCAVKSQRICPYCYSDLEYIG